MISKDEALRIIAERTPRPSRTETVALGEAVGRVLSSDIASDVDMPPFDKSAMDGYALRAEDLTDAEVELRVVEEIQAGRFPERRIGAGACAKIMTGAPLPRGADAVMMIEKTESLGQGRVRIKGRIQRGEAVCLKGEDVRAGDVVLSAGTVIRPQEVGLLAAVGCTKVPVHRRPTVGVLATGDELVAPDKFPGKGQIRESNGTMLTAQVKALGLAIECVHLGVARDTETSIRACLDRALENDVVVLSGGVSMGDYDLVAKHLKARRLRVLIERVAIKPGKPLIFGALGEPPSERFIFGLPGNPVSSFVTFELFVKPFLRGMMGYPPPHTIEVDAILRDRRGIKAIPRTQHVPAIVASGVRGLEATPLPWHGSADLRGVTSANAFIIVPSGVEPPPVGSPVRVHLLEPNALRPVPDATGRARIV